MFAGPNGSGKSTLIRKLQSLVLRPALLGVHLNADDIESQIRKTGTLALSDYGITGPADDIIPFLRESAFLKSAGLNEAAQKITITEGHTLHFNEVSVNSYFASVVVDFLRHRLLAQRSDFTFETVMSSPDKIAFLKQAQEAGYRTYLYYIATADPIINVSRVRSRVALGGHPVPEDKILKRYHGSLGLLR
jgi:predicted ABC-type ATPase